MGTLIRALLGWFRAARAPETPDVLPDASLRLPMARVIPQCGIDLIREYEGLRLEAYPDPVSGGAPWTIGYGHTGVEVVPGLTITLEKALQLLNDDLCASYDTIYSWVTVPLTDEHIGALLSFIHNVGSGAFRRSTLLRKLNLKEYDDAADELLRWVKAQGKVVPGLKPRREAERQLFVTGNLKLTSSSSDL